MNSSFRCFLLFSEANYAIMSVYLWWYKGGHCDSNGRTIANSGGGSTKTANEAICRAETLERGSYSGLQDTRGLAGEGKRLASFHRIAEVSETRGTLVLAFLPVAATRLLLISFQAVSRNLDRCCYLSSIVAHPMWRCKKVAVSYPFVPERGVI